MSRTKALGAATLLLAITLGSALYWLTLDETDPCLNPEADITAAIIADGDEGQAGLANRAIIMRGGCDKQIEDETR